MNGLVQKHMLLTFWGELVKRRKEMSMFKLRRPGIAIVLGIMISLSLFTSGAFAQAASAEQSGQGNYGVTATGPQQGGPMPRQMLRHRLSYSGPIGKWRVNHW